MAIALMSHSCEKPLQANGIGYARSQATSARNDKADTRLRSVIRFQLGSQGLGEQVQT